MDVVKSPRRTKLRKSAETRGLAALASELIEGMANRHTDPRHEIIYATPQETVQRQNPPRQSWVTVEGVQRAATKPAFKSRG